MAGLPVKCEPLSTKEKENPYLESSEMTSFSEEKQDARAFLRERFLRCISGFVGTKCELTTLENSILRGEYNGMDIDGQDIFLKNLNTPMGALKFALVRTSDVINMHLPCVNINVDEDKDINEQIN